MVVTMETSPPPGVMRHRRTNHLNDENREPVALTETRSPHRRHDDQQGQRRRDFRGLGSVVGGHRATRHTDIFRHLNACIKIDSFTGLITIKLFIRLISQAESNREREEERRRSTPRGEAGGRLRASRHGNSLGG